MLKLIQTVYCSGVMFVISVNSALAGSSGSPPAGDAGGGASEPSTLALMAVAALPGLWLMRRAMKHGDSDN